METIRVLLVEDNPVDALCVKESLERVTGANFVTGSVETLAEAKASLEKEKFDVLILDLGLPDSQGLETLMHVQDYAPVTPIVVFSGLGDERLAIEAVRKGAQDYLLKDQCDESSVPRAINFAIERLHLLKKIVCLGTPHRGEGELAKLFTKLRDAASREPSPSQKAIGLPDISDLSGHEVAQLIDELQIRQIQLEMQNDELRTAEQNLTELSQKYKDLFDFTPVGYLMLDEKGVIREANLTGSNLLGIPRQQVVNKPLVDFVLKEIRETFHSYWKRVLETQGREACEIPLLRREDNFPARLETVRVQASHGESTGLFRTVFWDITFRVEAEEQQKKLTTFQALYDLALSMTSGRELDETLMMVVEKARSLLGTDTAYIALRDEKTRDVYMHTLSGIRSEAFQRMRLPFGSGLGGKVAKEGKGFIVKNYFEEIDATVHEIVREEGLISGIAVPIQMGSMNLGVLYAFNRKETSFSTSFSEADLDTLALLGNLAAIEIVRKRQEIDLLNAFENLEQRVEERTAELAKANQRMQEEAIQREQAEAVLRSILSASPVGIGLTEKRIIKWANEAWMKMFGFEHEDEFVGKSAAMLYCSPEEYECVGKYLYESLPADKTTATDAVFKRKDGTLFDGHIRVKSFQAPHFGDGAISAISDISDRKQAEKALQEAEERVRLALAGADLGWWEWDIETGKATVDSGAAEFLGYLPDEIESYVSLWEELVHPEDKSKVLEALNNHLLGHTALFETRHRLRIKSGDLKWVLVRGKIVARDSSGKPLRIAGTFLDITDRTLAEEAVRQSEQRFRAVFEGAEDPISLKGRSLRFTQVNPAFEKLVGLPASKIIGKRHEDVFGANASVHIEEIDSRVLAGDTIEDEHVKIIRGVPMRFLAMKTPLRDSSGEIVGILTILHDITDRKRLEVAPARTTEGYHSEAMQALMKQVNIIAKSESTILLTGESGSGKDYLAKHIHEHSDRANGPYFSINCAAIAPELAESELFGHEKGAFTGAQGRKRGLVELAEGGTLLLNEVGELSLSLQAKLLTFLDTRSFMRVGGERHISVNARLIAATHRDLREEVEEKRFLEPLFHRLNVFPIRVPPLRERIEDLPVLVHEIMSRLASELGLTAMPIIDAGVIDALRKYDWPGNVRELRNVLERSLMLWRGGPFTIDMPRTDRAKEAREAGSSDKDWSYLVRYSSDKSIADVVQEVETSLYEHVLRITGGNKNEAAKLLKISRGALYRYIKRWEGKRTD